MLILIIFIVLFACYGKHVASAHDEILVKDVFEKDPETGEFHPGALCDECPNILFCTGYVNEKYNSTASSNTLPCEEISDDDLLPPLGLDVAPICETCDSYSQCTGCPFKGKYGYIKDCGRCDIAEICEGMHYAQEHPNEDAVCGVASDSKPVVQNEDAIPF